MATRDWLTLPETARRLGLTSSELRWLLETGLLPVERNGESVRVPLARLEELRATA